MRYGHLRDPRAMCADSAVAFSKPAIRRTVLDRTAGLRVALLGVALLVGLSLAPSAARAADPLEVVKLVIADRQIGAAAQQIVQVSLRATGKPVRAGVRVELRDQHDRPVGKPMDRVVQVAASAEQREFFRFEVPNRFGRFTVRVEVFTPDFKSRLLSGNPVFYAPFTVGSPPDPSLAANPQPEPTPEPGSPETPGKPGKPGKPGPPSFPTPKGLFFEKPDLVWENLDIQPPALLVGEPLKIKADLRNVGGDIARNIDVKVDYFNPRTPARLLPISKSTVQVLAPGDKVEMEFETSFPEDAQLGEYKVQLVIDPNNQIVEASKENNTLVSEVPVKLSLIKQVFPEPGYYFEQAGLFLFRWDSRRFDEFKVQVGTDPAFTTPDSFFDLPQGDKWTKDREIVPLEGELPDMAVGLMQKARADQLYWRVVGRSSQLGIQSVSQPSPFNIRRTMKSAAESGPAAPSKPTTPGPRTVAPPSTEARAPSESPQRQ